MNQGNSLEWDFLNAPFGPINRGRHVCQYFVLAVAHSPKCCVRFAVEMYNRVLFYDGAGRPLKLCPPKILLCLPVSRYGNHIPYTRKILLQ